MSNTAKFVAGASPLSAPVTLLAGANLQNTATNSLSAVSAAYDNQANLDLWCNLHLHFDTMTPGAPAFVNLYILVSYDGGTTYPPGTTLATLQAQATILWATVPCDVAASTHDICVRGLPLPPQKFKIVLENQLGATIPNNTNSTVKIETYNTNLNA